MEGYPDLVVHGPLDRVLLAELARTPAGSQDARARCLRTGHTRRTSPTVGSGSPGSPADDLATLSAVRADGEVAMTLEVR